MEAKNNICCVGAAMHADHVETTQLRLHTLEDETFSLRQIEMGC